MGKDFILSLCRWPQSLLLQICRPVHQQDKTLGVVAETVDHELLPVRGHVVGGRRRYGGYRRAPEQRVRRPHYHAIALLLDFRGHDLVGLREGEDFLTAPSPPRATGTAARNLPSAAGRELPVIGSCPSLHAVPRPVVASHGKDPDIGVLLSCGLARIKKESAVARPACRPNTPIGVRQQQLFAAGAVGMFLVDAPADLAF